MLEIAARARVSLGTVSHVINGKAAVRDPLRTRVLDAIRELGYQPSPLARGLRTNSTNIIGMIVPDISNPFFPAIVRGAEDVAYRNQYHLVLCNTDNDTAKEKSYFNDLNTFLPAGLIVIPSENADLKELSTKPIVCVDRKLPGWKGDTVTVANEHGALLATRHLLEMNHREIAMITGPLMFTNAQERLLGYKRAMRESGVAVRSDFVQETAFTREGGRSAALRLLGLLPRPTAIFAGNDLIAIGVLSAMRELNMRCPQDLSLVGFDGMELTEFIEPALSTIYQPGYQLGATAGRVLLERIRNPARKPQALVLDVELRVRSSVLALPSSRPGTAAEPAQAKVRMVRRRKRN